MYFHVKTAKWMKFRDIRLCHLSPSASYVNFLIRNLNLGAFNNSLHILIGSCQPVGIKFFQDGFEVIFTACPPTPRPRQTVQALLFLPALDLFQLSHSSGSCWVLNGYSRDGKWLLFFTIFSLIIRR